MRRGSINGEGEDVDMHGLDNTDEGILVDEVRCLELDLGKVIQDSCD